jgi:hypothetical protein
MHTVFRIQHIKDIQHSGITLRQLKLILIRDSNAHELNVIIKRMRDEITGIGWKQMGYLLYQLGANDKVQQRYMILLQRNSIQ